jgi:hypothetical protein
MAQSRWHLARAQRLEAAMFGQMLNGYIPADDDGRIAARLMSGGDRALATIQRYSSAAERSYYKAHTELLKSQQLRNEPKTGHRPLATGHCSVRNEPKSPASPPVTGHSQLPENLALRL